MNQAEVLEGIYSLIDETGSDIAKDATLALYGRRSASKSIDVAMLLTECEDKFGVKLDFSNTVAGFPEPLKSLGHLAGHIAAVMA